MANYTMLDLIKDVLPRMTGLKNASGLTIWNAANAVQSMIYKRLLENKSDLAVYTSDLDLTISAFGYYATLPDGFVSMAEKPMAQEVVTDWMAGTVTSYNNTTGALVVNVTQADGVGDTLADWSISVAAVPETDSYIVGTSTTSVAIATGSKSFTTQAGLSSYLTTGRYIIITSAYIPETVVGVERKLQPTYLDNDDHDEKWWDWYGRYGDTVEPYSYRPQLFQIIGNTIYVRPKPIIDVNITGKYNAIPSTIDGATDVIPWSHYFDEVFREGATMILIKGLAMPQVDDAFSAYLHKAVDSVINSRIGLTHDDRRLGRRNWI